VTSSDDGTPDRPLGLPDDVTAEQLDQVAARLRDLPPVAMPDDVAARLDAALRAAEPPHVATSSSDVGDTSDTSDTSDTLSATTSLAEARDRSNRRLARSGRALGLAAGVAAVLVVSGVVVSSLSASPAGDGGAPLAGAESDASQETTTLPPIQLVSSGTQYSTASLPNQVDTMLAKAEDRALSTSSAGASNALLFARVNRESTLRACIEGLDPGEAVTPLAVDLATFVDPVTKKSPVRDALVVVLPSPTDPSEVEVFVVAPDCSGPDLSLLYFRVIDAADLSAFDDGRFSPVAPVATESADASSSASPAVDPSAEPAQPPTATP
jgi:hypothetical protein